MAYPEPWYKNVWWSFRHSIPIVVLATWDTYAWWHRKEEGRGYGISPWYVTLVWWLVGLPLMILEQMSGYWATSREAWLRWVGCRSLDLSYLLSHRSGLLDWINDHGRINYTWLPPDGQKHGINPAEGFKEYGAWVRSDLVDKDPHKRTRFYVHVGGAIAALLLLALPLAAQSPVGTWR